MIVPSAAPKGANPQADRLRRLFLQGFSVMDVAESLCSFDGERPAWVVREFLQERDFDLVGVRRQGQVARYAVPEEHVTMLEMANTRQLREEYEGESWGEVMTPERLGRARELRDERLRRGRDCDLLDCVQFADKATILLKKKGRAEALGFVSKRKAGDAFAELQSLRNSLAHTQEIISTDWRAVVRLAGSLELLLSSF